MLALTVAARVCGRRVERRKTKDMASGGFKRNPREGNLGRKESGVSPNAARQIGSDSMEFL